MPSTHPNCKPPSTNRSPVQLARRLAVLFVLLCLLGSSSSAPAYSVLTHEQIVDLLWKIQIQPMLLARYPGSTPDQLRLAHAYAYGGSLIQDIGYYPFGSHFFSDLAHYVRSGDFVTNLLTQSQDINEYAFALGALAHYASDVAGHPAVNRSVAEGFPKLRGQYGPVVTYVDNPRAHIQTEFGFDVVQVAHDRFTTDSYHDFIGFQVSKPVLERAFLATYGIPLSDVIPNLDLSIGSFRYSVSKLIPQMTRVALLLKKDEIVKEDPTMTRRRFLYHLKRAEFRREWGNNYQRPGIGARILAFFLYLVPKIGPFKALNFKMPSTATELLYMQSVNNSVISYGNDLKLSAQPGFQLDNRDFDTGRETVAGEYSLTDDSYADLLNRLAKSNFAGLTPQLDANILAFYDNPKPPAFALKKPARWQQTLANITLLRAWQPAPDPLLPAATPPAIPPPAIPPPANSPPAS
jgi:hypothetical protein